MILVTNLDDDATLWEFASLAARALGLDDAPQVVPDPLVQQYVLRCIEELVSLGLAFPLTLGRDPVTGEWTLTFWDTDAEQTVERVRKEWGEITEPLFSAMVVSLSSTDAGTALGEQLYANGIQPLPPVWRPPAHRSGGGKTLDTTALGLEVDRVPFERILRLSEEFLVSNLTDPATLWEFAARAARILGLDDAAKVVSDPLVQHYVLHSIEELVSLGLARPMTVKKDPETGMSSVTSWDAGAAQTVERVGKDWGEITQPFLSTMVVTLSPTNAGVALGKHILTEREAQRNKDQPPPEPRSCSRS
ncbi:hypothetical protein [Microbacterium album]|uniref:hypothetical protein n=1 Tax=Microbacterium album TaxID=2053191 RepID=UPI00166AE3CA|nr:hypothetical protein [Microbacterium album]